MILCCCEKAIFVRFDLILNLWAWSKGVTLAFSRPGKPTDNTFVESFNGKVQADCIDQNWLLTLDDAPSKYEAYLREYNEERPHGAICNKTPMAFLKTIGQPSCPMA
jgi:putative transposase